jgi:hypothetical protein
MKARKGKKYIFFKNEAKKGFFACFKNYKKGMVHLVNPKINLSTRKKLSHTNHKKLDIFSDLELLTKFLVFR